jgi:hypothetical protein
MGNDALSAFAEASGVARKPWRDKMADRCVTKPSEGIRESARLARQERESNSEKAQASVFGAFGKTHDCDFGRNRFVKDNRYQSHTIIIFLVPGGVL